MYENELSDYFEFVSGLVPIKIVIPNSGWKLDLG